MEPWLRPDARSIEQPSTLLQFTAMALDGLYVAPCSGPVVNVELVAVEHEVVNSISDFGRQRQKGGDVRVELHDCLLSRRRVSFARIEKTGLQLFEDPGLVRTDSGVEVTTFLFFSRGRLSFFISATLRRCSDPLSSRRCCGTLELNHE